MVGYIKDTIWRNSEIDLRDSDGTPVEFGDTIQVTLPEIDHFVPAGMGYGPLDAHFRIAERQVEGKLKFWLSKGLVFRITKIITDPDRELHINQHIPLKRTVWDWRKVDKATCEK